MPITTYLDNPRHATDGDIREALRGLSDPPVVEQFRYQVRRPRWWNPFRWEWVTLYTVLHPLKGCEYQVINFYRDGSDFSIHTSVPKELVLAYLYGMAARRAGAL